MADGLIEVLNAFGNLLRYGLLPIYSELIADRTSYIRIIAAAFAGSSSAGVIVIYFRDKIREIPLLFCRDHVIVCGMDETAEALVEQFEAERTKTVVIGTGKDTLRAERIRRHCTVMLPGDPREPALLSLARVRRARAVLALMESDGMNAEIALSAQESAGTRGGDPLACILRISNPGLFRIIREEALIPAIDRKVRMDFYNGPALCARVLLAEQFIPQIRSWSTNPPLLIIVGAGRLGESLAVRASREWFERRLSPAILPIVLVDLKAAWIRDRLYATYPQLKGTVEITPVSIDVQSAEFQKGAFLPGPDPAAGAVAFVCLNDDTVGLTAALALSHHLKGREARILVRMDHNPGLSRLVAEGEGHETGITPFNSLSIASGRDLVLGGIRELLARAIHDEYLLSAGGEGGPDPARAGWEDLPERLRESNRRQAEHIMKKLRSVGCDILPMTDWSAAHFTFTPDEVEQLAEMEHARWMEDLAAQGYTPGSRKDPQAKTHPSMVPYRDLPEGEKEKDRQAVRMIPRLLGLIDFQVYRPHPVSTGSERAPAGS